MRQLGVWFVLGLAVCGCRDNAGAPTPLAATLPEGSASAPAFRRIDDAAPAEPEAAAEAAPETVPASAETEQLEGEPAEQADADAPADDAPEASPEDASAREAPAGGPLPDVEIKNVGMHIGGEDNSNEAKRPIRAEIAKHYDGLRRCYAQATDPAKTTTFGVDIRIPGAGGAPKVTNPRSGLKGEGVKECMVAVFEGVVFPKQPGGQPRMVSYSVEFRRK